MIALNRRRVMGGAKQPYDAQIEYLESTGTQYIDSLVNGNNNSTVEVDFAYNGTSVTGLFGARIYNNNVFQNCFCAFMLNNVNVQVNYNNAFVTFNNYYPKTRSVIRL